MLLQQFLLQLLPLVLRGLRLVRLVLPLLLQLILTLVLPRVLRLPQLLLPLILPLLLLHFRGLRCSRLGSSLLAQCWLQTNNFGD